MAYSVSKRLRSRVILLIVFILAGAVQIVRGQDNITGATVSGIIQDPNAAVIVGATASAQNVAQNLVYTTKTDEKGRFRFSYLPPGAYKLSFAQDGFKTTILQMTLTVGQTIELPISLEVGFTGIICVLEVAVGYDSLETGRTQMSNTILPKDITQLPLNGRNYLDLALLTPGVSLTNTGNNDRFAETSAVPGTGISTAGQRNLANTFLLDGLSANDDAADLAGSFYSQEVIREFQVITSGGITQFGRSAGGVINIATQSGTNYWHARGYGF